MATQVVSRLRDAFQVDLPLRTLFEDTTVAGLAQRIEEAQLREEGLQAPPLLATARSDRLPLSFAQQRLWFLDQLEKGSPFYNISRALRLRGLLDVRALAKAINEIIRRHESLRTRFGEEGGAPFQQIAEDLALPLPIADLSKLPQIKRKAHAEELAVREISQPFDLTHGPLLRAGLLRLDDEEHVLILTMHHIAADGWSLGVLFRELRALYGFCGGGTVSLPALHQYAGYAVWQRRWLQGEVLEKLVSY